MKNRPTYCVLFRIKVKVMLSRVSARLLENQLHCLSLVRLRN